MGATGRPSKIDRAILILKSKRAAIEERADRESAALGMAIHELEAQQTAKPAKPCKVKDAKLGTASD